VVIAHNRWAFINASWRIRRGAARAITLAVKGAFADGLPWRQAYVMLFGARAVLFVVLSAIDSHLHSENGKKQCKKL